MPKFMATLTAHQHGADCVVCGITFGHKEIVPFINRTRSVYHCNIHANQK